MKDTLHYNRRDMPDYIFYPFERDGMVLFNDSKLGLVDEECVCGLDDFIRREAPELPCAMIVHGRQNHCRLQFPHHLDYEGENENGWSLYMPIGTSDIIKLCPNFKLYYPVPPPMLSIKFMKLPCPLDA